MGGLAPYLVKRGIQALITLFVVTSIVWALFEAMPGDPTDPFYANPKMKPGDVANMAVSYGLAEKHIYNLTPNSFQKVTNIPNADPTCTYYLWMRAFPSNPRAISFTYINTNNLTFKSYVFASDNNVSISQIYLPTSNETSLNENNTNYWTDYSTQVGNSIQTVGVLPKKYFYFLLNFSGNVQLPSSFKISALVVMDTPLYVRYVTFIKDMFTLNFGMSYKQNKPVLEILAQVVPRTLLWFGLATILVYVVGIPIGTYIAWKRGGPSEGIAVGSSLFFYNMPSFWLGLIFIWIFSYTLGWTPIAGFASGGLTGPGTTCAVVHICPGNPFYTFVDYMWHLLLPLFVIILLGMAGVILLQRTAMLETMGEDYVLTAKAKGLPEKVVRNKHARRNAMLPIVTSFVLSLSYAIGGAVILEQIFSYQGVGYTYLQALYQQDFFLAGATLFIISLLVIIGNIIADVLYGILDPRVRIQ